MRASRPRASILSIAVVAILAVAVPAPASAAKLGSIFFWNPGHAATGTLIGGVYTGVGSFPMGNVSMAAAGRDSLALYTRSTGQLRTGRFQNGVYTKVAVLRLAPGYSHMIASCETLLLYNTKTGRAVSGAFWGGRLRDRHAFNLPKGLTRMAATCDSAWLFGPTASPSTRIGLLTEGRWKRLSSVNFISPTARLGGSADSLIKLDGTGGGRWGRLLDGAYQAKGSAADFTPDWSIVAGTNDTLLFYRSSDGYACTWTMESGERVASDCSVTYPAGWKGITGGK